MTEYVWRNFVLLDEDLNELYSYSDYESFFSIGEGKVDDREYGHSVAAGTGFRYYCKHSSWEDSRKVAFVGVSGVLPGNQGEVDLALLEITVYNHQPMISPKNLLG